MSPAAPDPGPPEPGSGGADLERGDDGRRPRSVYGVGAEPDARFTLANERTALAWVRTGLGLVAGGVALTSFASLAHLAVFVDVVAGLACLAGAGFALYAIVMWRRNERALRTGAPLPPPSGLPILVACVVVLALVMSVYAAWEAWSR